MSYVFCWKYQIHSVVFIDHRMFGFVMKVLSWWLREIRVTRNVSGSLLALYSMCSVFSRNQRCPGIKDAGSTTKHTRYSSNYSAINKYGTNVLDNRTIPASQLPVMNMMIMMMMNVHITSMMMRKINRSSSKTWQCHSLIHTLIYISST